MFALPRTLLPRRAPALLQKRSIYIEFQIPPPRGRPRRPNYNRFQQHKQTLRQPLVRRWLAGTAAAATGFYVYNLETVPITGRRRFNIISPATEAQLAGQMFQATMDEFRGRVLPRDHPAVKRVRRVMERLQGVSGLDEGGWEVFVVRDEGVRNAFVVPGGKVFVFSGILPLCADDDGLATVLSHEIAHTVAHHSAERMSKSFLVLAAVLLAGFTLGDPDTVTRLGRVVLDLAYLRPGSRRQEEEADYIGLLMMAEACYDPESAVGLWERMEKAETVAVPQFLSTHPSNKRRIENIRGWMAEAKLKSEMSDCHGENLKYAEEFMDAFVYPKWQ